MQFGKQYLLKEEVFGAMEEFRKKYTYLATPYRELMLLPSYTIDGNTSDGYHTFNELYHHRAILFSVICNTYPYSLLAWKSKKHHNPEENPMYEGMFIVGINTPKGQATYHYDIEPYWNLFNVQELDTAPEWDGHTPAEAIERISCLTEYSRTFTFNNSKRNGVENDE